MADWRWLARHSSISTSYATNGSKPAGAEDELRPFRDGGEDLRLGASTTELPFRELAELPLGRPGASSSASTGSNAGGPSGRTLYWHPRLTAGDDGVCRVQFPIPDSPLALRLVVLSHSGQKVGSAARLIPTVVKSSRN
jgi:hypothetical protein